MVTRPKWRPYWKRRSPNGTRRKKCVQPSYYIISKDVIYRLGKSKSLIGVFTLIRSRLPCHPHPTPPALMRSLCRLFLIRWKLQSGKTYKINEPCNTSESCQLIFVGQGENEAKLTSTVSSRVAKRHGLTWSSVFYMLSHLGSRLSFRSYACLPYILSAWPRREKLTPAEWHNCKLYSINNTNWGDVHKKHEFRQFSRGFLSILWHTLVNGYEICVSGELNFMQFRTLKEWLKAE